MRARLGFATADEANPTILLLDEVHEALDHEYRAIVQERVRRDYLAVVPEPAPPVAAAGGSGGRRGRWS